MTQRLLYDEGCRLSTTVPGHAGSGRREPRACTRFAAVLEASEVLEAVMSHGRISVCPYSMPGDVTGQR